MKLFSELKRRNVLRAGVLYAGAVWAFGQGLSQFSPALDFPDWTTRWFLIAGAIGFPFWLAFAWFYEFTPDGLKRESEIDPADSVAHHSSRKLDFAIIGVLAVAVVLLLTDRFLAQDPANDVTAPTIAGIPAATSTATIPDKSIAVIPLANAGGEGQQFFSDGLSEALIIALSQFEDLKVIGRNSSFQFRDTKDDSTVIGRKLGVSHLVEGSVQHVGEVVRISVQLVDAASGQTRWSQHYDRPYKNLFKLQDEITNAVATALDEKLQGGSTLAHDDRPPSGNLEAYSAYLRGLKYWHDQEFRKAAEYMSQAAQLDPGYALAWAHLSGAWSTVAAFWNEAPAVASEHMRASLFAADKALQLAPGLGAAHAARAYLHFYNFDPRGALAECRRAVQLAPEDGTVLNGCGYTLTGIGKLGEAIRLREQLLSTEPLYTVNFFQYSKLLAATGRLDEAEKYLHIAEGLGQADPLEHLNIALLRGDWTAAREIAGRASSAGTNLLQALAAQIGPDRAVADAELGKFVNGAERARNLNPEDLVLLYALRGDADQMLEWLQRVSPTSRSTLFLLANPFILRFRDDPRLAAFCTKIGLSPPDSSEALSIDQIRAKLAVND
ncbi:tetratricopeptide repeat protein [Dokdonella sp.]|uniref:tetratricopeptide repeat protein n=1 Tax=Dokdonella sp. TaxID=2291710 RepID=UPI003C3599F4